MKALPRYARDKFAPTPCCRKTAVGAHLQNAPGFVPVIINIEPMKDLRLFLGIQETGGNSLKDG